jgi:16S rRNA (cytidine1402-2'-O)-methyltransferase
MDSTVPGKLYLIPNVVASDTQDVVIPQQVRNALAGIQYFLAEDIRTARRFLSSLKLYSSIESLRFEVLDKDTDVRALPALFEPLLRGHNAGVVSESGCPGVADPGAVAVRYAHDHGIPVVPLVGPSSLLLALMASGLNGQRFAFHGYLPVEGKDAAKAIRELERESRQKNQTQLFIETPYRNNNLLGLLIKNLADTTRLSVSVDLTGAGEQTITWPVKKWRTAEVTFPKVPAVFLFLAI